MYEITVKINNDFIDSVNNICSLVYELNSIMEYSIKNGLKYEYCEGAKVNEFKAVINAGKEIDVNIFANINNKWVDISKILPGDEICIYVSTVFNKDKYKNNIYLLIKNNGKFDKDRSFIIFSILNGYKDYLKTYDWNKTRKETLKYSGYKCQLCGKNNIKLNIHHNTYENLGKEEKEDLIALCCECHKKFHNIVKNGVSSEK